LDEIKEKEEKNVQNGYCITTGFKMFYVCLCSAFSTEVFGRSVLEMQTGFVLSGLESHCTWYYRLRPRGRAKSM